MKSGCLNLCIVTHLFSYKSNQMYLYSPFYTQLLIYCTHKEEPVSLTSGLIAWSRYKKCFARNVRWLSSVLDNTLHICSCKILTVVIICSLLVSCSCTFSRFSFKHSNCRCGEFDNPHRTNSMVHLTCCVCHALSLSCPDNQLFHYLLLGDLLVHVWWPPLRELWWRKKRKREREREEGRASIFPVTDSS